jgi:hypothetical protein
MSDNKEYLYFNPRQYLNDYYAILHGENRFLMDFFHEVYSGIEEKDRLLEVGGGPTIYQLISACQKIKQIFFSEYLEINRQELKKWQFNKSSFNWDNYFYYVLQLEGKKVNKRNKKKLENILRDKIIEIFPCDIYKKNPLSPKKLKNFDVLSVNFTPESITDNIYDFENSLKNIFGLLKKEGLLVMTMLRNAQYYQIGEHKYRAFSVNEKYIKKNLKSNGLRCLNLKTFPALFDKGFDGIIALTASKI